jgi:complement component 1 Q subcomponent-binding protein
MFSIADIQSAEEDPEYEQEEGEGAEDQALNTYPVRASFSVTKVCFLFLLLCLYSVWLLD